MAKRSGNNSRIRIKKSDKKCAECGTKKDLSVDHIIPRVLGGSNRLRNIQILCKKCNMEKGEDLNFLQKIKFFFGIVEYVRKTNVNSSKVRYYAKTKAQSNRDKIKDLNKKVDDMGDAVLYLHEELLKIKAKQHD